MTDKRKHLLRVSIVGSLGLIFGLNMEPGIIKTALFIFCGFGMAANLELMVFMKDDR